MSSLPHRRLSRSACALSLAALSCLAACGGGDGPAGPVPVTTVAVTAPTTDVLADQTLQLTAVPRDGAGQPLAGRAVTWRSEDSTVARVDATGLVTGMLVGVATIVAASEGKEGRLHVVVHSRVKTLSIGTLNYFGLGQSYLPAVAVGGTRSVSCGALDSASAVIPTTSARWSSSNPAVATVQGVGSYVLVTGVAPGKVTLTATFEGVRAEFPLVVRKGYTLTEFNGFSAQVTNLNEQGHVVGKIDSRAFLWRDGEMIDLGLPKSIAWDVNDLGQVVGEFDIHPTQDPDPLHPFLWVAGQVTDLAPGAAEHTHAMAINGQGDVVGYSGPRFLTLYEPAHAVVWRGGQMQDLGTLAGGSAAYAVDINAQGDVVGFLRHPGSLANWPYVIRNGQLTELGVQNGLGQTLVALGDDGTVVGNTDQTAFLWKGGALTYIPTDPGAAMRASDVNGLGQVVGQVQWSFGSFPFLWSDGVAVDLGWLVIPSPQLSTIRRARAINDRGQIAVETSSGIGLLTPVP